MSPRAADMVGAAMLALYLLSLVSFAVALALSADEACWLFLGSAVTSGATMCLVGLCENRLGRG